jgi:hypothetical protein
MGKQNKNKQWTYNRQSQPWAPLIHGITGGRVLQLHTTPWGRPTVPPAGSKCKIVITGLKIANKYSVVSILQMANQEKI